MILWTRVSLASFFAAAALAATGLAWRASSKTCPLPSPAAIPQVDPPAAEKPMPEAVAAGEDTADSPEADDVAATGDVDVAWLPPGYLRELTGEQTSDLTAFVNDWITGGQAPAIEYRRGVARVHSDEDRGDDGPYPRSASGAGDRICGEPAVWMRDALRERLHAMSAGDVSCSHNVCSYGGMEYAPTGYLVFRPITVGDETTWALDAWIEVYEASLGEQVITKNHADVTRLMKRVAPTSCAGEPAGTY